MKAQGPLRHIGVHEREQEGFFFCSRVGKAGNAFRDLKTIFFRKKGVVLSKCTKILQTQTYLGGQI